MRNFLRSTIAVVLALAVGAAYLHAMRVPALPKTLSLPQPGIPASVLKQINDLTNAPLEVALVFGRSAGCDNADPALINLVAQEAVRAHVPAKVLAATVAVESGCNPMAISKAGAVGLTQVLPKAHKSEFDFANKYNLLNPKDNVHVGAAILASYINQYGLASGVHHYNGMGIGCDYCDAMYSNKILVLAGGVR